MKVSVVIPTLNDEGTIAATVKSALAQRFGGGFEVVVSYLRLGWATLPATLSRRISPLLAPGLRRSLSGPPFTALQDSP